MTNPFITPFLDALNVPRAGMESRAAAGERFIGYFCTHTPMELIHAAGFTPVRITGGPGPVEKAYAHLPDFICPFLKRSVEKGLEGEYNFLSGTVQAYTCDAACGTTNIWREITGGVHHVLPLPYNDGPDARKFMKSAILELINILDAAGGKFSDTRLEQSIDLYGMIRGHLLDLHHRLHSGASALTAKDLYFIHAAGYRMAPAEYLEKLDVLARQLPQSVNPEPSGCPVLLSGSLVESASVYDAIASAGGLVVADDLCSGYRQLVPAKGAGDTPVDQLVDRCMNRLPCPSRSRAEARSRQIAGLLVRSRARGVVLIVQKFCTPHLSDYPILSAELKTLGCPSILIEMDEFWQADGQVVTRISGFIEMLEA